MLCLPSILSCRATELTAPCAVLAAFLALPQRGGATVEGCFCNLIGCLLKAGNEGAAAAAVVAVVVAECIPQCFAAGCWLCGKRPDWGRSE